MMKPANTKRGTAGRGTRGRTVGRAWAAAVVVACGVGWGLDLFGPPVMAARDKETESSEPLGTAVRLTLADPGSVTVWVPAEGGRKSKRTEVPLRYSEKEKTILVGDTPCEMYADFLGSHRLALTELRIEGGKLVLRGKSLDTGLSGESEWTEEMLKDLVRAVREGRESYPFTLTKGPAKSGHMKVRAVR